MTTNCTGLYVTSHRADFAVVPYCLRGESGLVVRGYCAHATRAMVEARAWGEVVDRACNAAPRIERKTKRARAA